MILVYIYIYIYIWRERERERERKRKRKRERERERLLSVGTLIYLLNFAKLSRRLPIISAVIK